MTTINNLVSAICDKASGLDFEQKTEIIDSLVMGLDLINVDMIGHYSALILNEGVGDSFDLTYEHDYNAAEAVIEIADILDEMMNV